MDDGTRNWSADLRPDPRRQGDGGGCRWLKEERTTRLNPCGGGGGSSNSNSNGVNGGVNVDPVNIGRHKTVPNMVPINSNVGQNLTFSVTSNLNVPQNNMLAKGKEMISGLAI